MPVGRDFQILFFFCIIFLGVTLTSSDWILTPLPALPYKVEIPENSSITLTGGLFEVCFEVENLYMRDVIANTKDRYVYLFLS